MLCPNGVSEIFIKKMMMNFRSNSAPFNTIHFSTTGLTFTQCLYVSPINAWRTLLSSINRQLVEMSKLMMSYLFCAPGTSPLERVVKEYNIRSICDAKKARNVAMEIYCQHNAKEINKYWTAEEDLQFN